MQFNRIELDLETCEKHLDATGTRGTEVEYYLTQYLLTRIYAEYQTRLRILIERRCSRSDDVHLRSFAERSAGEVTKFFLIGEIKGVLGHFGDDYKKDFDKRVMNTLAHVAWDNLYNNRIAVAHKAGAVMSFYDLKMNFQTSLEVFDSLIKTLGLKAKEVKDLK